MMKQRKIPVMGLMMITSQLLLSIFLAYWVYSQFAEKKNLLRADIERGLRSSEEQVIDSMLATNLINPFINDSSHVSVFMADSPDVDSLHQMIGVGMSIDTIPQMRMHISEKHPGETIRNPRIFGMIESIDSIAQSVDDDTLSTITLSIEHDSSNQLLFQGVKLLINAVGKFEADQNSIYTFFSSNPDTTILIKIFGDFIEKNYRTFSADWQPVNQSKTKGIEFSHMVITSYLFENPYGVILTNFNPYLVKSISLQIAFAFILFLITAVAFRMAFINLKNQRKLLTIKNDFISNITHELKTPVSTVKVAIEALLDFNLRKDPEVTKEYLEMAHSEMERLDLLVNQVLNNSVLEDNNSFISTENIDLVSLVKEVTASMQSRFDNQNAIVTINSSEEEIIVDADKLHLQGVIVNLLDNSLKYTKQRPEISLVIRQNQNETQLIITDNGIGVPDEYIDRIFDKFFRVPKGDKHNVKGYGLGLNYAALVMEHHHGKIGVKCNNSGGCSFTLILPRQPQG